MAHSAVDDVELKFHLGEDLFLCLNRYKGFQKVHIRKFKQVKLSDGSTTIHPTRFGITMKKQQVHQLMEYLPSVSRELDNREQRDIQNVVTTTEMNCNQQASYNPTTEMNYNPQASYNPQAAYNPITEMNYIPQVSYIPQDHMNIDNFNVDSGDSLEPPPPYSTLEPPSYSKSF